MGYFREISEHYTEVKHLEVKKQPVPGGHNKHRLSLYALQLDTHKVKHF